MYAKNTANMGADTVLYHLTIEDLVEKTQEEEENKPGEGEDKSGMVVVSFSVVFCYIK